jgi:hypothetical protein
VGYTDGSKYEGEWVNFKKHGKGVNISKEGNVEIGKFVNGLLEGYGESVGIDGDVYKGNFGPVSGFWWDFLVKKMEIFGKIGEI